MKKTVWIIIAIVILLGLFGCKKKEEKLPSRETASAITTYAPLPSFKEVFRVLDQLQVKDISAAVPADIYKTKQE